MRFVKSKEEIDVLREGGHRLAKVLEEVARHVGPGVTTKGLDTLAESLILSAGGVPSFKGYRIPGARIPYPGTLCTSVNDEVVHGIPSERILEEGDIIGLDIGMRYPAPQKGVFSGFTDMAVTVPVGAVDESSARLIEATRRSLNWGIIAAVPAGYTGDIGAVVQHFLEEQGYGVVRDLVGHGVGYKVHEEPEVPNFGKKGTGVRLFPGMVLALEPMVTAGKWQVKLGKDGWTWSTKDGSRSAHFEHTIVITEKGSEILTKI